MSFDEKRIAKAIPERSADFLRQMILVKNLLQNKELQDFLNNPKTSLEKKYSLIDNIEISRNLKFFLKFLIREKKVNNFQKILAEFKKILKNPPAGGEKIAVSGIITSACAVSENEHKNFEANLSKEIGCPVVLETITNPDLIGGITLTIDDQIIDLSYKAKLNKLRSY